MDPDIFKHPVRTSDVTDPVYYRLKTDGANLVVVTLQAQDELDYDQETFVSPPMPYDACLRLRGRLEEWLWRRTRKAQ